MSAERPLKVAEVAALAKANLSPMAWDYFAGGARDEVTLRDNRDAWGRLRLHYRVLRGVEERVLRTQVVGQVSSMPVLVAPTAFHRLAHPEGEVATARAAAEAGVIMCLSTLSTVDMEAVCAAAPGKVWFQLYVYKDRGLTRALVERAEAAGCRALVVTVDAAQIGVRERDERNGFHLPAGVEVKNLVGSGFSDVPTPEGGGSGLVAYVQEWLDPALRWEDIDWLRSITRLPILVKGIVRADDARLAADWGAVGIVVSNHGGRQLDTAPATAEVLPAIADAVGGRVSVLVDGGIRRGTDVVKALALGADAVMVGRPILWGLGWRGQEGVGRVLGMLRSELEEAMALCGCGELSELTRDLVTGTPLREDIVELAPGV